MIGTLRFRAIIGLAAACVAFNFVSVAPAVAAVGGTGHPVAITMHQHQIWTESGDPDFCTNESVTPTITGNEVAHLTYFT